MSIKFSLALPGAGYVRTFKAEIDCLSVNELLVHGQLYDHRYTLQHVWIVRTPDYDVMDAKARQIDDEQGEFDAEHCDRYQKISGIRIGRGFTKRIIEALGTTPGYQEHLFLAIEMARAAQQVYQFPPDFAAQPRIATDNLTEKARASWLNDRAYMPDLKNSCYTYRDESEKLFDSTEVRCGFDPEFTRPQPGDKRVFWREKQLKVNPLSDSGYACESAMQDTVHDIRVYFDLRHDGVIANAESRGLRLPYHGICEDAQQRTTGLNGLRVTRGYVKQFAEQIGGSTGCTHLFDLSIDCLRLFKFTED